MYKWKHASIYTSKTLMRIPTEVLNCSNQVRDESKTAHLNIYNVQSYCVDCTRVSTFPEKNKGCHQNVWKTVLGSRSRFAQLVF